MRPVIKRALLVVLVLVLVALVLGAFQVDKLLASGAGLSAKHLCSLVYVSGLDFDVAREHYIDRFFDPLSGLISAREIEGGVASRAVWRSARAEYRPGVGCTLRYSAEPLSPAPPQREHPSQSVVADEVERAESFDVEALDAALDRAVARPGTFAVLAQHRGRIVGERYANGANEDTPLPGWSMVKSVMATAIGVLDRQGRVDLDAPGALVEWRGSADARAEITLEHLLRMTSGLEMTESQSGMDTNSRMLFSEPDGAAFSARRKLLTPPGSSYDYMSGSTVLATRVLHEATGDTLEGAYDFLHDELFGPLGMATATPEPDESGTFIGSSFFLASARDWAQLGQLYLNGGEWLGQQIITPEWIDFVLRLTPESGAAGYGAGLWLLELDGRERWSGVPKDAFYLSGFQGQATVVVPSEDLVVVRLGASPSGSGAWELVPEIVAARRPAPEVEAESLSGEDPSPESDSPAPTSELDG